MRCSKEERFICDTCGMTRKSLTFDVNNRGAQVCGECRDLPDIDLYNLHNIPPDDYVLDNPRPEYFDRDPKPPVV